MVTLIQPIRRVDYQRILHWSLQDPSNVVGQLSQQILKFSNHDSREFTQRSCCGDVQANWVSIDQLWHGIRWKWHQIGSQFGRTPAGHCTVGRPSPAGLCRAPWAPRDPTGSHQSLDVAPFPYGWSLAEDLFGWKPLGIMFRRVSPWFFGEVEKHKMGSKGSFKGWWRAASGYTSETTGFAATVLTHTAYIHISPVLWPCFDP